MKNLTQSLVFAFAALIPNLSLAAVNTKYMVDCPKDMTGMDEARALKLIEMGLDKIAINTGDDYFFSVWAQSILSDCDQPREVVIPDSEIVDGNHLRLHPIADLYSHKRISALVMLSQIIPLNGPDAQKWLFRRILELSASGK